MKKTISERVYALSNAIQRSISNIVLKKYKTVPLLVKALNRDFKTVGGVRFRQSKNRDFAFGVGGFCYFHGRTAQIEIVINYTDLVINYRENLPISITELIVASIIHELVHRRQYEAFRTTTPNIPDDHKGYLSHHYELSAHATEIAYVMHFNRDMDMFNAPPRKCKDNISLYSYMKTFRKHDPIRKQLMKKVYKNVSLLANC